ncbi:MAG: Obg family GTPase CgtA [Patescibacteria group bacterium]
MLIDNIKLTIKAGNGGKGSSSLFRGGQTANGGPDGGNGGNGGSIYFQGSHNYSDLRKFRYSKKVEAQDGQNGKGKKMYGRKAPDMTISLPLGTRITNLKSGVVTEITDDTTPILFAKGGTGGRGNVEFKSSTNQTPINFEQGGQGETKELFLELRLIAEVGLIGLPNSGKSSLLKVLTKAHPAVGDYPFTTLEPTIGMLEAHPIADIPGLIEGASHGKGLGIDFLRHIEKTTILIHCIDITNPDPLKSYEIIREEFRLFDPTLLDKTEYILLTKTDLVDKEIIQKVTKLFTKTKKQVLTCSIYDEESMESLKKLLKNIKLESSLEQ